MPKAGPGLWVYGDGLDIGPGLGVGGGLLPESGDEDEGLGASSDVELAEGIAEAQGAAEFGGLGIDGETAVAGVCGGGNVPFLGVARGAVVIEKGIAEPALKPEAMVLDLAGGRVADGKKERAEAFED